MHSIDGSCVRRDQQIHSFRVPNTSYLEKSITWIRDHLIQPIDRLVSFIYNFFDNFDSSTFNLDSIKSKLLTPAHIVPASDNMIHCPLINLGATCYMNSCLQILASCNTFNPLFTKEIVDADPVRLQKKQSLQKHLGALINILRNSSHSESISYENLKTLFTICQALGWHTQAKNASIQADAGEFLLFLTDIFDFESDDIHTFIFNLEEEKNEILTDQVISHLKQNQMPFTEKKPPSFLIVNEARSVFQQGRPVKVHSSVDVPVELNLQAFNPLDPNENNPITYQLEAAICHHSKYSVSGHYTAIGRYSDQFYIKYDDKKPPKVLDSLDEIKNTCTQLFYRLK